MSKILNGNEIAQVVKQEISEQVLSLMSKGLRKPSLHVILVGEDEASKIYVRNKIKACKLYNIDSVKHVLPASCSKYELEYLITTLNQADDVDGILLQLPLPDNLKQHESYLLQCISPEKDVDGFHPLNIGKMTLGLPAPISCTPAGCLKLLEATGMNLQGKKVLIIGRSNTVGKPLIQLLLQKNMTVSVAHSYTTNLDEMTLHADVIIAAVGKTNLVKGHMVKDGVVVIDVGINRASDGSLTGDVEFHSVEPKCSYITPVPGGVGPMTIAMLLSNTLLCYRLRKNIV